MSLQAWFRCLSSSSLPETEDGLRAWFEHTPLEGRTDDPEALDWDLASALFFRGVRLARCGKLDLGRGYIAIAYLLDTRAIYYIYSLPENMPSDLKMFFIDRELLYDELVEAGVQDICQISIAAHVIRIMLPTTFSASPLGQAFLAQATKSVNFLLWLLEEEPEMEDPDSRIGALGGCLNRPNLLFLRSNLYLAIGNRKEAIKDWTKALQIDPSFLKARIMRAIFWATLGLKDNPTIFSEFQIIIQEAHPDQRNLDVAYGWLTLKVLQDPSLGSLNDAKNYYTKCLRAAQRRTELYGARKPGKEPAILNILKKHYATLMRNPAYRIEREICDILGIKAALAAGFISLPKRHDPKAAYACFKCGKTASEIDKPTLKKCDNCKIASYCSRECQLSDWREHKLFCKIFPNISYESAKEQESSETFNCSIPAQQYSEATTPMSVREHHELLWNLVD